MMRKFMVVMIVLLAMVFTGCGNTGVEDFNQVNTVEKRTFKNFRVLESSIEGTRVALDDVDIEEEENFYKMRKIENTFSSELQLKQGLLDSTDLSNAYFYVIDKEGKYYELWDELEVGKEYTIIESVFDPETGKEVFYGERDFTMKDGYVEVFIKLDISKYFYVEVSIFDIFRVKDITDDVEFTADDNKLKVFINHEYSFERDGKTFLIKGSYNNFYDYLVTGEFKITEVNRITGVSSSVSTYYYEDLRNGFYIKYDSEIEDDKLFSFSVIVEKNTELIVFGEGDIKICYYDKDWNIIYPKAGDIIPGGVILNVEYYNTSELDVWFYGNEEENIECDGGCMK